jgi:uncharacterized membrane protein
MQTRWKPLYAWITVVLLHAVQTIYYYPRLPALVAQHFRADGNPNGWAPRELFFGLSWVILLLLSALLMLTPRLLRKMPVSVINLPNKQYWLAPERKAESLGFVQRQMEWMGVITVAFLVLVTHFAIRANLNPGQRLENTAFIVSLVAFVVLTFWEIANLYHRFPKVEAAEK